MRVLPLVLSSVLTLAVGLLIGMEISGDSTEARERDLPIASDGGRVSSSRSVGEVTPRSTASGSPQSRAPSTVITRPQLDDRQIGAAIRRVESPTSSVQAGRGVVRGRVARFDGSGVAGATVILTYREPRSSGRSNDNPLRTAPKRRSLDEALRAAALSWARTDARTFRVSTIEDGSFEVTGLADGNYRVSAYLEGFQIQAENRSSVTVSPGGFAAFSATPLQLVTLDLRLPDGTQPASATLALESEQFSSGERIQWTADSPRVAFANTRVKVLAGVDPVGDRSFGGQSFRFESDPIDIDVLAADEVRIDLKSIGGIEGRIRIDRDDASAAMALRGALVGISPLEHEGATFDPETIDFAGNPNGGSQTVKRLNDDRFQFSRLKDGAYGVALKVGSEVRATAVVEVTGGFSECELVVEPSDDFGFLAVVVTAPDGSELTGLRLMGRVESESSGTRWHTVRLRSMPDGRRGVPFVDFAREFPFTDWPDGVSVWLDVSHPRYGDQQVALTEGQREVEVRFREPAELLVQVPDAIGSPIVGQIQLSLSLRTGDNQSTVVRSSSRREPQLDDTGSSRFIGLVPGEYELHVALRVGSWRSIELSKHDLVLRPGEQNFVVGLPVLHSLSVRVPGASVGVNATLQPVGGELGRSAFTRFEAVVGADGRVVFPYVLEGDYRLSYSGSGASMTISVPTAGEVMFEAQGPNTLRVAIADEEGTMYRAGLRSGDMILRINEVQLTADTINQAWGELREGPPRLEVLRDGRTIVVQLSEEIDFRRQESAGGTFIAVRR